MIPVDQTEFMLRQAKALGWKLVGRKTVPISDAMVREAEVNTFTFENSGWHEQRIRGIMRHSRARKKLPPVILVQNGHGYSIYDGMHRVLAERRLGRKQIDAIILKA